MRMHLAGRGLISVPTRQGGNVGGQPRTLEERVSSLSIF